MMELDPCARLGPAGILFVGAYLHAAIIVQCPFSFYATVERYSVLCLCITHSVLLQA